ncbi:MAG: hypothetical protein OEZ06_16675 [Myxococcales bacterium]|nr:hypothetical protein [Myxococcales bacterium]
MSAYRLVDQHLVPLLAEAERQGVQSEAVARALVDRAMLLFKRTRSLEDIRRELEFISEALDDDEEYPFMRP